MRRIAPILAALAAAGGIYAALAAADPKRPPPEDPWLEAWREAGLKAEFRAETDDPGKSLLFVDGRGIFKVPPLERLRVRHYLVTQTNAQVVELPDASVLREEFPEGRTLRHKLKPKGGEIHVCRAGRRLLLLSTEPRVVAIFGKPSLPKKSVEAIFQAFEDAAR